MWRFINLLVVDVPWLPPNWIRARVGVNQELGVNIECIMVGRNNWCFHMKSIYFFIRAFKVEFLSASFLSLSPLTILCSRGSWDKGSSHDGGCKSVGCNGNEGEYPLGTAAQLLRFSLQLQSFRVHMLCFLLSSPFLNINFLFFFFVTPAFFVPVMNHLRTKFLNT